MPNSGPEADIGPRRSLPDSCIAAKRGLPPDPQRIELIRNCSDGACEDCDVIYCGTVGRVKLNAAPCSPFDVAHICPPWPSTIDRQIDSPMPMPPGFVV